MTAYETCDATGLAALVASGKASPHELLDAALERADRWQPSINALCHSNDDLARQMIDAGLPDGPLKGVPFLLKDIGCETPDFPVSGGSRATPGDRYPVHCTLYSRLRAAGLVPFARTTTPENAIGPVTEAAAYGGPTRNPWNLAHTPGGSSGGAGAAVAAGIVPAAQGSDGGGSIRIPASCCGLFGMKPSRARIPDGPYAGEGWAGMAMDGVLTRSVRDQALLLDLLSGTDLGAPYFSAPMAGSFLDALRRKPGALRIAVCPTTFEGKPIDPECRAAVEKAAKMLETLGHSVEEARPKADQHGMMAAWTRIVACGTESWARAVAAKRDGPVDHLLEPVARGARKLAQSLSGADYLDSVNTVHAFGREMAAFFENGPDILLSATLAEPPAKVGRFAHSRAEFEDFMAYRMGEGGVFDYSPFTAAFNASGQPAVSLPLHWTDEGHPIGIHLAAAIGRDALLISLSAQLEEAAPWDLRRPEDPAAA